MKKFLFISLFLSVFPIFCMEIPFQANKKYITEIKNELGTPVTIIVYRDPMRHWGSIPFNPSETAMDAKNNGNDKFYWEEFEQAEKNYIKLIKQEGNQFNISVDGKITQDGQPVDKIDVTLYSAANRIEIILPSQDENNKKNDTNNDKNFEDSNFFKESRLIISKDGKITIEQIN